MISHKDPTGFTIEAFIVLPSVGSISRRLPGEGEVNGQALVWDSGSPYGLMTRGCFCLFCSDTSRASRHDRRFPSELWNTSNRLVSIIQVSVIGVAESLVPQPFFRLGFDGRDRDRDRDLFKCLEDSEWKRMEGCRSCGPELKLFCKRGVAIGREVAIRL